MASAESPKTPLNLQELVVDEIKLAIIFGRLRPRERLIEDDLSSCRFKGVFGLSADAMSIGARFKQNMIVPLTADLSCASRASPR